MTWDRKIPAGGRGDRDKCVFSCACALTNVALERVPLCKSVSRSPVSNNLWQKRGQARSPSACDRLTL